MLDLGFELRVGGAEVGVAVLPACVERRAPLADAGITTLILGCTHYPLLTGVISYVMGERVSLVSSAEESAKDVYAVLTRHDLLRPAGPTPPHRFLTTGAPAEFAEIGARFLGPVLDRVDLVHVGDGAAGHLLG